MTAKRFIFNKGVLGDTVYNFRLNPQQYEVEESAVIQVQRTALGGWVDHYGEDFNQISLRGISKNTDENGKVLPIGGLDDFKRLREVYRTATIGGGLLEIRGTMGAELEKRALQFHCLSDGDSWWVIFKSFRLRRSVDRPLYYQYDIEMVALARVGQGESSSSFYQAQAINFATDSVKGSMADRQQQWESDHLTDTGQRARIMQEIGITAEEFDRRLKESPASLGLSSSETSLIYDKPSSKLMDRTWDVENISSIEVFKERYGRDPSSAEWISFNRAKEADFALEAEALGV